MDLSRHAYTCGKNISPPLQEGTKNLVLICDNLDALKRTWNHWIIFNLPFQTNSLPEGMNKFLLKTQLVKNSWDKENYGDPCLPDKNHYYVFKLC